MKLNQEQTSFIRLVLRSDDIGDGWRRVSCHLESMVLLVIDDMYELFETRREKEQFYIRLSEKGKTVAEYT